MKHEGSTEAAAALGVSLTAEQAGLLERYQELLATRGIDMGVVASGDLSRLWERHLLDALRGAPLLPPGSLLVADLGSGGGIPGIPLAIARPDIEMVLVEARRRRGAFLELVVDTLRLPRVSVLVARLEAISGTFDVCVARAFAPPAATWEAAARVLGPGGSLLYWAGEGFDPASDVPDGVRLETPLTGRLAHSGPVVIMCAR